MQDATQTRTLAAHIAASPQQDLPANIVVHAEVLVLDTPGVALSGATLPWCDRSRATVGSMEAPGEAADWGTAGACSTPTATRVGAAATHALELDDGDPGGHRGSVRLSSALTIAQHTGRPTAKDRVHAAVVGIEAAARIGKCVGHVPHEGLGFHHPGLPGSFATVAVGRCHALAADDMAHALGHAGQRAASLVFTHHGGMGQRFLAGQATRAGTFGGLLATNGFTDAESVFEAAYGGSAPHTRAVAAGPAAISMRSIGTGASTTSNLRCASRCGRSGHRTVRRSKEYLPCAGNAGSTPTTRGNCCAGSARGETQNVARAYTPTTIASATLDLHFAAAIMQPWNGVFIDQFTEQAIADPRVLAASSTANSATPAIRWSSLMLDVPTFA